MSKDTPEVGDVWEYDNTIYHIVEKGTYRDIFDGRIAGVRAMNQSSLKIEGLKLKYFIRDGKYLGKSKANIDDLFKTENEDERKSENY